VNAIGSHTDTSTHRVSAAVLGVVWGGLVLLNHPNPAFQLLMWVGLPLLIASEWWLGRWKPDARAAG
jgi:hypothetical protein